MPPGYETIYVSGLTPAVIDEKATGAAKTPFLLGGDTVRIEMKDAKGHSIFGAIEQTVERI